jgi:hypothetical protein
MVLNKRRDVENGVRALLLKVGTPSRKDFSARVGELAAGDAVLIGLVDSLLSLPDSGAKARALWIHAAPPPTASQRSAAR